MDCRSVVARTKRNVVLVAAVVLSACSQEQQPVQGFILPPGDIDKGRVIFVETGCPQCHTVADSDIEQPPGSEFHVKIGGEVRQVKHYGDLLTSIVNPDHKVSRVYRVQDESGKDFSSPMPQFAETMTVSQMIDLVEFLHSTYQTSTPEYGGRYYYYYGPGRDNRSDSGS